MADHTTIGWTQATWNPTIGCSKVSPGCDNCYAIRKAIRPLSVGNVAYRGVLTDDRRDWSGQVNEVPERLGQPLRWRRPRLIFVDSMSDLFHPQVSDAFIADVFAAMSLAPQHQFQVLTKRPQRMADIVGNPGFPDAVARARSQFGSDALRLDGDTWPLPNVWLGASVESNRYAFRADHVRRTPAAIRWLSLEPLLSRLSLDLTDISWVVVGGESGPGHRPMDLDWLWDIAWDCHDAGIPLFVKQDSHARSGQQGRIPDVLWRRKQYPREVQV